MQDFALQAAGQTDSFAVLPHVAHLCKDFGGGKALCKRLPQSQAAQRGWRLFSIRQVQNTGSDGNGPARSHQVVAQVRHDDGGSLQMVTWRVR